MALNKYYQLIYIEVFALFCFSLFKTLRALAGVSRTLRMAQFVLLYLPSIEKSSRKRCHILKVFAIFILP